MSLREDYEKTNKWVKEYESLEKIVNEKHSPLIKTGIGYNRKVSDPQYQVIRYEIFKIKENNINSFKICSLVLKMVLWILFHL